MSTRLCLCVLIAFASASAAARDVKLSSPHSGSCPEQSAEPVVAAKEKPRPVRQTAPVRESRARPAMHSDAPTRPSLRWHSFLPGMFR